MPKRKRSKASSSSKTRSKSGGRAKKRRRRESEVQGQGVPHSVTDEQQGQRRRSLRVAAAANSSTTTSSDTSTTTNSDTSANTSSSTADALPVVVPALPVDGAAEARVSAEILETVAQCESRRRGQARPNIYIPDLGAYREAWRGNMRNIRKLHTRQKTQTMAMMFSFHYDARLRSVNDAVETNTGRFLDLPANADVKSMFTLASQIGCSMMCSRLDSGVITNQEPPHLVTETSEQSPEDAEAALRLANKDWGRCLVVAYAKCPWLAVSMERLLFRRHPQFQTRTALYAFLGHSGPPPMYLGMGVTDSIPAAMLIDPLMDIRQPPPTHTEDEDAEEDDEDDDSD